MANPAGFVRNVACLIPTHRECAIQITNMCSRHTLCNPRISLFSGGCASPLPPTVGSSTTGSVLFTKTPHTAKGAVGVFTYDLRNNSTKNSYEKLAVMFSVPYDFNLYSNWYAVGIFGGEKKCDYNLYCEMYYHSEAGFVRGKASGSCQVQRPSCYSRGNNVIRLP